VIDLARDHLEANVEALGIGGLTLLALRDAQARGRYVVAADGTQAIELDGKLLDGPVQPHALEDLALELDKEGDEVVVLFGIGAGNLARLLRERTHATLVVFEPDPGILRTALSAGPSDLGGVPVVCDLNDLKAVWARFMRANPRATTVHTPGYAEAFHARCDEVTQTVRAMLADEQCVENTRRVRFSHWIDNLMDNLPRVAGTVPGHALEGRFAGMPAFIVGAGPSLDKNAEVLREASSRGLVIAVNSSAPALAARGITPHVVACIESLDLSKKLAALPYIDDVVRAFSLASHPDNLKTGRGPLLPILERIPAFEGVNALLGGAGAEVGGSVSTVAFWLARALGCSPIVMVGQDLAFTGMGTYATGTSYEESQARVSADGTTLEFDWNKAAHDAHGTKAGPLAERAQLIMVDAWGGPNGPNGGESGEVATSVWFASFRVWFEVAAAVLTTLQPGLELINATEGGARIKGFKEERLADVVARFAPRATSPADLLREEMRAAKPVAAREVTAWAARNAALAKQAGRAARRVQSCADAALRQLGGAPAQVGRAFAVLERAEAYLRRACKAQPLIEGLVYADVQSRMEPVARADASDAERSARRSLEEEIAVARSLLHAATKLERALRAVSRNDSIQSTERNERHGHRHADERRVTASPGQPRS
jgi:hypothetical protein